MELFSEVLSRDDFYEIFRVTDDVGNDDGTPHIFLEGGSVAFSRLETLGWHDFYCFFAAQRFLQYNAFLVDSQVERSWIGGEAEFFPYLFLHPWKFHVSGSFAGAGKDYPS